MDLVRLMAAANELEAVQIAAPPQPCTCLSQEAKRDRYEVAGVLARAPMLGDGPGQAVCSRRDARPRSLLRA